MSGHIVARYEARFNADWRNTSRRPGRSGFPADVDKCSRKAIRNDGHMEDRRESSDERDADEISERESGDLCIEDNGHSQAALRSVQALGPGSRLARASILLGQYSLVCYIAQINFMQALYRQLSRPRWELRYETIFVVFATVVFLLVLNAGRATLCERRTFEAKAYKLTFRRARLPGESFSVIFKPRLRREAGTQPGAPVS
jgi:hypothetical protein